jgi:HSP20 family molecular chaperone IbpA
MSKRKNPLDESLTELMDAWMELLSIPKRFQGVIPDIAKQVPTMNPKQHIGDWEDRNGEIAVTVDMPGIVKDDIELTVDANKVSIKAKTEDRDYSFTKEFKALGYTLNPAEVSAEFNNGVLDIKIQKSEEEKGHRIDIK